MGRNVDPESTENRLMETESREECIDSPGQWEQPQEEITMTCADTSVITRPLSPAGEKRGNMETERPEECEKERRNGARG